MKQQSTISIIGLMGGGIFALGSFARYFVLYPDLDKLVAYVSIGVLIMAVSSLYQRQLKNKFDIDVIQEYLSVGEK